MTTLNDKLKQVLAIKDESEAARSFEKFCQENFNDLPLPGENSMFDRAMWTASQFLSLSKADEEVVKRVTTKLETRYKEEAKEEIVFHLKDLLGQARDTAIGTWQDMLGAMSWQQMVPAGATRVSSWSSMAPRVTATDLPARSATLLTLSDLGA